MSEINKTRKIIGWALSLLPILAITASGLAKLMGAQPIVESLSKINMAGNIFTIGLIELRTCLEIINWSVNAPFSFILQLFFVI